MRPEEAPDSETILPSLEPSYRLLKQAAFCFLIFGRFGWQHFQRNLPAQLLILRLVDFAHSALSDFFQHAVMENRLARLQWHR